MLHQFNSENKQQRLQMMMKKIFNYQLAEFVELALYLVWYSYQNVVKSFLGLLIPPPTGIIAGSCALKWILIVTCAFQLLWITPLAFGVFLLWLLLTTCKFNWRNIIDMRNCY